MTQTSYATVTDQFCGAGGSSLGATHAGAEIRLALNHWRLAVDTHNSNFPNTDHDCTDVSACDPRRYPATTILITSPECTNHSLAKGKARKYQQQLELFGKLQIDPSEERSRATMWDVCRFAETHHYPIVIVENVVEARWWAPFDAWLHAMELLGYRHQIVYLNSMFQHPTPQSRDRMYVVFWLKGQRAPDLDFRPAAHCPACGINVSAIQSWKNPRKRWGKYGQQYVYRCPTCAGEVTPYYYCAANAIDWSLPAPRIGDRARPLKEKTLKRIRIGLEKFGRQPVLVDYVHTARNERHQDMVWDALRPHRTMLGIHTQALVTPPFTIETQWSHAPGDRSSGIDEALPTQTGQLGRGLVVPPFIVNMQANNAPSGLGEPMPTMLTGNHRYVLVPPIQVYLRGENAPKELSDPLSTVAAGGNHHGLVFPFITSFYGTVQQSGLDAALPTQPSIDKHVLVTVPFLVGTYGPQGQKVAVAVDSPSPTITGTRTWALAAPGATPEVEDCGFRMLQPHEIGAAMAFPGDYVVLGTQRDKVKQYGNAVTPPVMRWLVQQCLATLGGGA